jgi:hypothetical protein
MQVCLNGREWLARQRDAAGVTYRREDNCFPCVADLHRRAEVGRAATDRYLTALAAVQVSTPLAGQAAGVCRPVRREGRRQAIDELLAVGAVVFAEAPAQLHGVGFLMGVGAGELDGGRIVVDWGGLDIEALNGLDDQGGEQAGAIGLEESV